MISSALPLLPWGEIIPFEGLVGFESGDPKEFRPRLKIKQRAVLPWATARRSADEVSCVAPNVFLANCGSSPESRSSLWFFALTSGGAVWLAQLPTVVESEANSVRAQWTLIFGGVVATIALVGAVAPGFVSKALLGRLRESRTFAWCLLSIGDGPFFGYLA